MGFSRQEYWSELPCPPPGDLPGPGIEPVSLALQADSLPSEEMPTSEKREVWPLLVGMGSPWGEENILKLDGGGGYTTWQAC